MIFLPQQSKIQSKGSTSLLGFFMSMYIKNNSQRFSKHHSKRAFTLIEMMVSVALFLIVMTIALGAVLSIIDGNKKTQAINSVSNNLSSAIENMVRDLKTGYDYRCNVAPLGRWPLTGAGVACNPGTAINNISFKSTISGEVRSAQYYLKTDTVTGRKTIVKYFCPAVENTCLESSNYIEVDITSSDIDVQSFGLYVNVPAPGTAQPSIFMLIRGTAYVNSTSASNFSIQTFVSQRLLNI